MKRRAKATPRRVAKPKPPPYDVVVLVASAGGHAAIGLVLRGLPEDFPIPIVVMQHLSEVSTEPLGYASRRLAFKTHWASSGATLTPGTILVGPPLSFLEVLPDGSCRAHISVPVLIDGQLRAVLAVSQSRPRRWTPGSHHHPRCHRVSARRRHGQRATAKPDHPQARDHDPARVPAQKCLRGKVRREVRAQGIGLATLQRIVLRGAP
jgi:hypothetical protein